MTESNVQFQLKEIMNYVNSRKKYFFETLYQIIIEVKKIYYIMYIRECAWSNNDVVYFSV